MIRQFSQGFEVDNHTAQRQAVLITPAGNNIHLRYLSTKKFQRRTARMIDKLVPKLICKTLPGILYRTIALSWQGLTNLVQSCSFMWCLPKRKPDYSIKMILNGILRQMVVLSKIAARGLCVLVGGSRVPGEKCLRTCLSLSEVCLAVYSQDFLIPGR